MEKGRVNREGMMINIIGRNVPGPSGVPMVSSRIENTRSTAENMTHNILTVRYCQFLRI